MTRVFCTLQFEAFHYWPEAPKEVDYLAVKHRHMFHVRIEWTVAHENRDKEFITAKKHAQDIIKGCLLSNNTVTWSCERWAGWIAGRLDAVKVEVSEDGENGAVWTKE